MVATYVALNGDPVSGMCNGHYDINGIRITIPYTGTWVISNPRLSANNISVVRIGDTGVASCGHTFQAIAGSIRMVGPGGIGIHRRGDAIDIINNGGFNGPGVTNAGTTTPKLLVA